MALSIHMHIALDKSLSEWKIKDTLRELFDAKMIGDSDPLNNLFGVIRPYRDSKRSIFIWLRVWNGDIEKRVIDENPNCNFLYMSMGADAGQSIEIFETIAKRFNEEYNCNVYIEDELCLQELDIWFKRRELNETR